jgi:hypothetical protein
LGYHDFEDIGSSGDFVRVGDMGVRSKDQTGVLVGIITWEFPLLVVSREFQSTRLAIRTGIPPPEQVRSTPISGREGES